MSSAQPPDAAPPGASKKKKNNKKKSNKPKPATDISIGDIPAADNDEQSDEPETPQVEVPPDHKPMEEAVSSEGQVNGHVRSPVTNGHSIPVPDAARSAPKPQEQPQDTPSSDMRQSEIEAMTQEREKLRLEVEQLRKQLQSLQETHEQETGQLKTDLEESEAAKEQAETQYQTLLGRVEKIKETLGDRLKRDKAELEEAKDRIEELESQNQQLTQNGEAIEAEAAKLREEAAEQARELSSLRSRSNLSQQNWLKEKEELSRQAAHLRSELESTSTAMGEWEVIAMEERSTREGLSDKVADLEEQLMQVREAYERAASERDSQSQAVDGLQRALQEIQEARKRELREMVESSESQLQEMKARVASAEKAANEAETAKQSLANEVERTAPFEKEVKEKNLLIGKLRHEAIVLNDHLTKALRYLMKTKPEESVDRQIVTNYFLQFLALDRSDPKKFQVLQVIAGMLNWTDEQKEQAGLARPGGAGGSLRLPASPFHRTPSTPSLSAEFFAEPTPPVSKESLAELWTGFLQRSAAEGSESGSRHDSVSSSAAPSLSATPRPDTRG